MAKVRLEEILKKKKISKRKFIKLLKTDSGTARRYFQPGFNPTLATLEKFAKVLKVKIRDLIKE
jgi:transcriptional regulator with XRE-family HTH domain